MMSDQPKGRFAGARRSGEKRRSNASGRVLIVEPDPLARSALAALLRGTDLRADHLETIDELNQHTAQADIVLLCAPLRGGELARAIRRTRRLMPSASIVVLANPSSQPDPVMAFRAGARGYLIKDARMSWLPRMLRRNLETGSPALSAGVADLLVSELDQLPDQSMVAGPSDRELEVLSLIGEGLTNHEIADALAISISTVKTHVRSLLEKLDATNRVQLTLHADQRANR